MESHALLEGLTRTHKLRFWLDFSNLLYGRCSYMRLGAGSLATGTACKRAPWQTRRTGSRMHLRPVRDGYIPSTSNTKPASTETV